MKHLFKFSLCALALTMGANTGFAQSGETGLKDAYKDYFSIGVAVNMRNISNPEQIAIIKKDFNSITAENDMKPQPTEPAYGQFSVERETFSKYETSHYSYRGTLQRRDICVGRCE